MALGWALYAGALCVVVSASIQMGRSLRVGLPRGRTSLVTSGLFSETRNPIYTAAYAMMAGTALLAPTPWVWAVCAFTLFLHHFIILGEERFLARRFGRAWAAYCRRVGRYLWIHSTKGGL